MIDRRDIEIAAADFCISLRRGAEKVPLLERILQPRLKTRTFEAGGLVITTEEEESYHAERYIKTGVGAEMTADRLQRLMQFRHGRRQG